MEFKNDSKVLVSRRIEHCLDNISNRRKITDKKMVATPEKDKVISKVGKLYVRNYEINVTIDNLIDPNLDVSIYDEKYYYYILNNPLSGNSQKAQKVNNPKIFKTKYFLQLTNVEFGEGGFSSIIDLKKKSMIYNNLKSSLLKFKIIQSKNIKESMDFVLVPTGTNFKLDDVKAFLHSMYGDIKQGKAYGMHSFLNGRVRIIEILKRNEFGFYNAKIQLLDKKTLKWIDKKFMSSSFPDNWSLTKIYRIVAEAFKNKIEHPTKIDYFIGSSNEGFRILFGFYKNGKLKTIYPEV